MKLTHYVPMKSPSWYRITQIARLFRMTKDTMLRDAIEGYAKILEKKAQTYLMHPVDFSKEINPDEIRLRSDYKGRLADFGDKILDIISPRNL